MPVGTKATVKTMRPEELKEVGTQILLGNTYHLYLHPGAELIQKLGGLHQFMHWEGPILTDSGGFQVFSLGGDYETRNHSGITASSKSLVKLTEEGVEFRSVYDGSKHFFTPEKCIQIQCQLGADIMMALDECAPADSSKQYAKKALKRTHDWASRCVKEWQSNVKCQMSNVTKQALFPIIQGVVYDDLRIESAKFISNLDCPGLAIGGLSVGESKATMLHVLETIEPHLPKDKPRYLMGVGMPEDLLEGVERGIDLFDCVLPTRLGRHGHCFTHAGKVNLYNQKWQTLNQPLDPDCRCSVCQNYSIAYLHHLIREKEILGIHLATYHNLHFLLNLMTEIRAAINADKFPKFKKQFLQKYQVGI